MKREKKMTVYLTSGITAEMTSCGWLLVPPGIEYMEEAQGGVAREVGVANRDNTNTIEKILKRGRRPISGMLQGSVFGYSTYH